MKYEQLKRILLSCRPVKHLHFGCILNSINDCSMGHVSEGQDIGTLLLYLSDYLIISDVY